MKIISYKKALEKLKNKIDRCDLLIAITVFAIGLINNFYFIIGDGVAPDSLSTSFFNIAGKWELQLGRFLIRYVNYMRYGLVNKLLIVLISLGCITISVMLLRRLFKIKSRLALLLMSAIICIAPQFTETYMFIYCADAYLVAFMFSVLAVYFLNKTINSKLYYLSSCMCVIIVCALYQAYLGVILGLILILIAHNLMTKNYGIKAFIVELVKFMLAVLVGVITYYICLKVLLFLAHVDLASYKGANSVGLNTILNLPKTIVSCYIDFYRFFFTDKIIYNGWFHRKYLYLIMCLFVLIVFAKTIINSKTNRMYKALFVLILSIIYPICVNVMNIIATGTRVNLVTGPGILITALIPILFINKSSDDNISNITSWALISITLLLSWSFILENNFTYSVREQTFNNYKIVSTDIYTKATSLEEYKHDMKWMFSDVIRFKPKDAERANGFISNDNVTWNNYSGTIQNKKIYEKYLGVHIDVVDRSIYDEIKNTEEFKSMPIYPEKGSIKIINDVIVVKTSEFVY